MASFLWIAFNATEPLREDNLLFIYRFKKYNPNYYETVVKQRNLKKLIFGQ